MCDLHNILVHDSKSGKSSEKWMHLATSSIICDPNTVVVIPLGAMDLKEYMSTPEFHMIQISVCSPSSNELR